MADPNPVAVEKYVSSMLPADRLPLELEEDDLELLHKFYRSSTPQEDPTSENDLKEWIFAFHDKAIQVFHYPCLRRFGFVKPRIQRHPFFKSTVLPQLLADSSTTLLDVGCCLGTDLRYLTHVLGVSPQQLKGLELLPEFLQLGHEFFHLEDSDPLKPQLESMFVAADILTDDFFASPECRAIRPASFQGGDSNEGMFNAVFTGSVLHLFSVEQQDKLLSAIYRLLKPGGAFFGYTTGLPEAGEVYERKIFLHNGQSLKEYLNRQFQTDSAEVVQTERSTGTETERAFNEVMAQSNKRISLFFSVQKPL